MESNRGGRVVWVTGAGRGIGRAVALAFARAGWRLVLVSRTEVELASVAREARALKAPVLAEALDIRHLPSVQGLLKRALARFGAVDVLVNNASILGPHGPLIHVSDVDWAETLAVNLSATFRLTREVLTASMLPRRSGCILNVSSSVGRRARSGWGPYAASKFGLEALTQTWGEELASGGVRIYSINPGATRTRMRAEAYPDEDPMTLKTPEAAAKAFLQLASPSCRVPSGAALDLDRATGKLLIDSTRKKR